MEWDDRQYMNFSIPAYDDLDNLWLYFGTGDRNHPNNTTTPNRIFGITDSPSMINGTALTESNLAEVTRIGKLSSLLATAGIRHALDEGVTVCWLIAGCGSITGMIRTERWLH